MIRKSRILPKRSTFEKDIDEKMIVHLLVPRIWGEQRGRKLMTSPLTRPDAFSLSFVASCRGDVNDPKALDSQDIFDACHRSYILQRLSESPSASHIIHGTAFATPQPCIVSAPIMPPRKSGASKKAAPASAKSHKRQLSDISRIETPGSRASKRLRDSAEKNRSAGKATPTKSKYFEDPGSESDNVEEDVSGYEDEDEDLSAPDDSSDDQAQTDDDFDSEADGRAKRQKSKKARKASGGVVGAVVNTVIEKGKELWRPGVTTGLGPGKQVFIEKPKPRGDGGIKYTPEKIHPNTMAFLKDLKANNDREWLKGMHTDPTHDLPSTSFQLGHGLPAH